MIQLMTEYKKVAKLSLVDAAYVAGLIDGEGTITLTRRQKNKERCVAITIANTELDLLEFPLAIIKAGIITSKKTFKPNHSASYVYQISGRQALDLLEQITPFLKSYKKNRAQFLLKDYIRLTPRNGRYTADQLQERKAFVEEFFTITANGNSPHVRAVS
ncbi:MAG: hypothetical protein JWM39_240 [Parcubacteria group bacterium]|jgi:hypothetical protein|nr:hypothetical protein [Parcubacteria group bacterium]